MTGDLLHQVAEIAESLQYLIQHPSSPATSVFETHIDRVLQLLEHTGFDNTLGVAKELEQFRRDILRGYNSTSSLSSQHETQLVSVAQTVKRAFHHEAQERETIVLNNSAVAESLYRIPKAMPYLTEAQQLLREEIVRNLQVESYRSAIVMAWCFAYDYVRKWVFSEHRDPFNQALQAGYQRNNQRVYLSITHYEDFWEHKPSPGEWVVLETCQRANILSGKAYDGLCEALRTRNDYAHPNFLAPSADLTKGYIAGLLQLITNPPFPKPKTPLTS